MTDNQILHIYTRVSTNAQEEKGTSLASQKQLGIKKAEELGFSYKVWNEGGASSNYEDFKNRPVLLELLSEINDGSVGHLWVYNNDRLSRNDITAQTIRIALQKNGVTLYTKDGTYDLNNPHDKMVKGVFDLIAQYDNAIRAERTRIGKLNRVKEGFWQGGQAPFGYQTVEKKLVLHPVESEWVKRIFEWYADRKPIEKIKKEMDKSGVKTRHGKYIWSVGSINKLLQNTHHKGEYSYEDKATGEVIKCKCSPIVTKTLWNKCQDHRRDILKRKGQAMGTTNFYLLRDLMYCGHCNHHMAGRIKPNKYEKFYYCPKKERDWKNSPPKEIDKWVRGKGCTMTRSLNIDATDKLVWDTVIYSVTKAMFEDVPDLEAIHKSIQRKQNQTETEIRKSNNQIKKYKAELKDINKSIADVETEIILKKKSKDIGKTVIKNLQEEHDRIQEELEQLNLYSKFSNNVLERALSAGIDFEKMFKRSSDFNSLTPVDKKEYLTSIIEKITVFWDEKLGEHQIKIEFLLKNFNDRLPFGGVVKSKDLDATLKKKIIKGKSNDSFEHPTAVQPRHRGVAS